MKYLSSVLFVLICVTPLSAAELNITTLLEAVEKQPGLQSSQLETEATQYNWSRLGLNSIRNSPHSRITKDTIRQPICGPCHRLRSILLPVIQFHFLIKIERYGLKAEMPLFVKGLYTLADKVKQLQKVSKLGHKLNVVTRQAEVVSVDASLAYVTHLNEAIVARLGSLQKTHDDLQHGSQ